MISKESFDTIMAFIDQAVATEQGPARERVELIRARGDLDRAYQRARQAVAVLADPDGPTENVRRLRADRKVVEEAIARHVSEGLRLAPLTSRPIDGDLFPSMRFAQAQWHATRAQLLAAAPVTVAAATLREEALAALDTNPKDTTS